MRDDDGGFASLSELGENLGVKYEFEFRILFSGPLVENVDGPILDIGRNEGQSLPLPLRKLYGGKRSAFYFDLTGESETLDVFVRFCVQISDAVQAIEHMTVRQDCCEALPVRFSVLLRDPVTIERDASFLGFVQTHQ